MRDFLKRSGRRVLAGWFWPLALLTLPRCALVYNYDGYTQGPSLVFDPGPSPVSGAVMCDIPKPEAGTGCADPSDVGTLASLASAAVVLNLGDTHAPVLDFSATATAACGGLPKKVDFFGPWPDGLTVCLNCGTQIPAVYANATAACVAQCIDSINFSEVPTPAEGVEAFCGAHAHVATNFKENDCFQGFCSDGGMPIPNHPADTRRNPEDVSWTDFSPNTSALGSTLSFAGPGDPLNFIAGAASVQLITIGDAWVEFEAGEPGVSHVVGLRTSCDKIADCPDMDGTLADIPLALSLNVNGDVNIIQNGAPLAGPFLPAYTPGERFRINVVDHNDKTADISFFRYATPCVPDNPCPGMPFFTYKGTRPNYPLRVDATFREAPASVANVTIMRIIQ